MTKILHFISSIDQVTEEMVRVIFKEKVSNIVMREYLDTAQQDWTRQGFAGTIPIDTLNQIRNQRFQNEFMMKFPFYNWKQRDLKINDLVEIDMPLMLDDVVSVTPDIGI